MNPILPVVRRAAARHLPVLAALLAAAVAAAPAGAQQGDALRGRLLYENHCLECHSSRAHVRANRKAHSAAAVRGYVNRWQQVQGLSWSQSDIDDVTTWLYLRFYDPARPPATRSPAAGASG